MAFDARREGAAALAALQFLTRLPVPAPAYDPAWLRRGAKYFPLVGLALGLIAAVVFWLAARLWPQPIPALLALLVPILITGAFHEDGLADLADSAGGMTRASRLAIMKDSRLGTFGALALFGGLALEAAALAQLAPPLAFAALPAAHAGGRALAVLVMARAPYAGDVEAAKAPHLEGRPSLASAAFGLAAAALPLAWLGWRPALAGTVLGGAVALWLVLWARRALGGYTGDVLGAVAAAYRPAFLLGLLAVLR